MKIVLVRHGESEWNLANKFTRDLKKQKKQENYSKKKDLLLI
jgi:bisphosphoglycerate-dependent phosphoglycerate mutase